MPRGKGVRCFGFISEDGRYAHCTRDEFAGSQMINADSGTYAHRLDRPCNCGVVHTPSTAPQVLPAANGSRTAKIDFSRCPQPYPCDYCDEGGAVLFRVARWMRPDGSKTYSMHRLDSGGAWVKGRGSASRVVYRLPEVRKAIANGEAIHITEGEKKAHLLLGLGLCATCNAGGAGKFSAELGEMLRGAARVVIWQDNDEPGRRHAQHVARLVTGVGVTDVRLPVLPGLEEGEGLDNWIGRPSAPPSKEQRRVELEALVDATAPWKPVTPGTPTRYSAPITGTCVTSVSNSLGSTPGSEDGKPQTLPVSVKIIEQSRLTPTDVGNATRLVRQHGETLRFVTAWGRWLIWNGRRWAPDEVGAVTKLAKATAATIYAEAAGAPDHERTWIARHALRSESALAIAAMLKLAESEVAVAPNALDANAWLLNVDNGTIDLRTGKLRAHAPKDLITKLAPVLFDDAATSPVWDAFLDRVVPDPDLRAFLARAAGYTLTGDTSEERLFFVHGPTASGKSTFTGALGAMLGSYGATCDFETFLRKRGDGGARNDIARLVGVRMAVSLEVDEGRTLAEALVKNLTGGDMIAARFLYHEHFEYRPAFKLWLVANDRPRASATDGALWRRILLVPFDQTIPENERDPAVKAMLTRDPMVQAAVLAWAVRGLADWQVGGLRPPAAVTSATAAYRAEQDHIGAFASDRLVIEPGGFVTSAELRSVYETWCTLNGEKPLTPKAVGKRLRDLGAQPGRADQVRGWNGVRLGEGHQ